MNIRTVVTALVAATGLVGTLGATTLAQAGGPPRSVQVGDRGDHLGRGPAAVNGQLASHPGLATNLIGGGDDDPAGTPLPA